MRKLCLAFLLLFLILSQSGLSAATDLEGVSRTILFNLSGHGHFDISGYEKYFENNLPDHELSTKEVEDAIANIGITV